MAVHTASTNSETESLVPMSSSGSPQAKLMHDLHEAFEKKDIELLTKPLHEDFRYATYP